MISGITEVAHITTKQDMSRWTRAHADVPGIRWSVFAGPGGTMIIVEHAEDRCSLTGADYAGGDAPPVAAPSVDTSAPSATEVADITPVSA